MINVLRPYPGQTAYETDRQWLARLDHGVLTDITVHLVSRD
jgi:hypothetical protein